MTAHRKWFRKAIGAIVFVAVSIGMIGANSMKVQAGTCTHKNYKYYPNWMNVSEKNAEYVVKRECVSCAEVEVVAYGTTTSKIILEPSCTNGEIEWYGECEYDGVLYSATTQTIIPATQDHVWNYDKGYVCAEANCKETGLIMYPCTNDRCWETKSEQIPIDSNNHTGGTKIVNSKEATESEEGYEGDTVCNGCGAVISTGNTIPKLDHIWDSGELIKIANCYEQGVMKYTCTGCGDTKEEYTGLDSSNHSGGTEIQNDVAVGCDNDGYTGDTICSGCKTVLQMGNIIEKTGHSWGEYGTVKAATCSEKGISRAICSHCGDTKEEDIAIDPDNHTGETEITNAIEATCTMEGYTGDTVCKSCGITIASGQSIDKVAHQYDNGTVVDESTCHSKGSKKYRCVNCDDEITEEIEINPHNHSGGTEIRDDVDASCSQEGYSGNEYCLGCGVVVQQGIALPQREHNWNNGTVKQVSTCTVKGIKEYACADCGVTKTEEIEIDSNNHVNTDIQLIKETSCSSEGYSGDTVCLDCHNILVTGNVIPKSDHSWDSGTFTKAASCKEKGEITYHCQECSEIKTEEVNIDSTNHVGSTYIQGAVAADCVNNGYSGDIICDDCGAILSIGTATQQKGHNWNDERVKKAPNCIEKGIMEYICSDCGEARTEDISLDSNNHTGKTEIIGQKDADCENKGYTGDTHCKDCGVVLSNGTSVDKKNHSPLSAVIEGEIAATCRTAGEYYEVVYCSECDSELSRTKKEIPMLSHQWNDGKVTTPADCHNKGIRTYTCEICGDTKTEEIPIDIDNHTGSTRIEGAVDASCLADGYSGDTVCNECNVIIRSGNIIQKLNHSSLPVVVEDRVEATCNAPGEYYEVEYCEDCHEEISRVKKEIAQLSHNWNGGTVIKAPSYTEDGVMEYECQNCGEKKAENIDMIVCGHSETERRNEMEATCSKNGYSGDIYCKECGEKISAGHSTEKTSHTPDEKVIENVSNSSCTEEGSYDEVTYCKDCHSELSRTKKHTVANGHTYDGGAVDKVANCICTGIRKHTCIICGDTYTEIIPIDSNKHTETEIKNALEASCTNIGYTGDVYCKGCGKKISSGTVIEQTEHVWADNYIVDIEPSCSAEGRESIHCQNCTATKNGRTIAKTKHSYGEWEEIKTPSCTVAGAEQKKCDECGALESRDIPALGHKWNSEYTIDKEATCSVAGEKSIHCKNCSETKDTEIIPILQHSFGEWEDISSPSCTDKGSRKRICGLCGYVETENVDEKGHSWDNDYTVDQEPSCSVDGSKSIHCSICEAIRDSQIIEATGHKWDSGTITREPTKELAGIRTYSCSECETQKTEAIEKLPNYKILESDGDNWTASPNNDYTFRIDGEYDKFRELVMDGMVVASSNYTTAPGSTIITIKAAYLETLNAGSHTITAIYTDGEVSLPLQIAEKSAGESEEQSPQDNTSDENKQSEQEQGETQTNIVQNENTANIISPKTGDNNSLKIVLVVLMMSAVGIIFMLIKIRKERSVKG